MAETTTPNFEQALRLNFRFVIPGVGGVCTTEDLFQFTKEKLDRAYTAYKRQLKDSNEESLLTPKKADPDNAQAKADILAYIIVSKQAEETRKKEAAARRVRKQQLLELLDGKQSAADQAKTKEEIEKEIAELDAE